MKTLRTVRLFTFLVTICLATAACGGGGSGADGAVVHGTLTQVGENDHEEKMLVFKHSDGEGIDGVTICLYGECSITDSSGAWGVNLPELPGGDVLITINGHGITDELVVTIPSGSEHVTLDLANTPTGVTVTDFSVDTHH